MPESVQLLQVELRFEPRLTGIESEGSSLFVPLSIVAVSLVVLWLTGYISSLVDSPLDLSWSLGSL